jgi:steroid 5-alpha reductase family enzyme
LLAFLYVQWIIVIEKIYMMNIIAETGRDPEYKALNDHWPDTLVKAAILITMVPNFLKS